MEKTVNEGFKNAVLEVIQRGFAQSKKEIAQKMGLSPSYFSELLNNRINLSAENLQKFCIIYSYSPDYILGISVRKNVYTPTDFSGVSVVNEPKETYSLPFKNEKLDPKQVKKLDPTLDPTAKNVSPTVSPTHEKCQICDEKERVIAGQQEIIQALRETIDLLRLRVQDLEDHLPDKGKKAG
jgi:transcriptional regulator with XRE-family HTH domain